MTILTAPLVGMHFHPPAKQVIAMLPADTTLTLTHAPENEYDPEAIEVRCDPKAIPLHYLSDLEVHLPGYGLTLDDVLQGPIFLGFIARTNPPKVMVGNHEVLGLIGRASALPREHTAKLAFALDGKPLVIVEAK